MSRRRRIFWRIYPPFLLIILVSLLAATFYSSFSLRGFYLKQTARDLAIRARLSGNSLLPYVLHLDPEGADRLAKRIGAESRTRITVVLPSGRVIADSHGNPAAMENHRDRPEVRQALLGRLGESIRHSGPPDNKLMYVAVPVMENGKVMAVLRAALDVSGIDQKIMDIQLRIIFGGLFIALIAAGTSLWVSRRVTRPIEAFTQEVRDFAKGEPNHRLRAIQSGEMGELAEAMNRMAAQLQERVQTVLRQRNELKAVLSSMVEGVMALDTDEKVIWINPSGAALVRQEADRLVGRSIQEVIRNPRFQHFVKRGLSGETASEQDIVLYGGQETILHAHTSPLADANGHRIGTLVVFQDVTRLRQLETIRRDFAANVSHEIKTPLTAIKGFVETLQGGAVRNPEEAQRFLGIIKNHADRLTTLIDDLMQLSVLEQRNRREQFALEKQRLNTVLETAIEFCRERAEARGIALELVSDPSVQARINARLFERAVVNLLDNAIKYSDKALPVRIRMETDESGIRIRFEDQGIGIAPEHLPRLFERFYRVDKARSRKLGGTGLGLAIVKHIISSHGGTVTVESTPGRGSVFEIHLPVSG